MISDTILPGMMKRCTRLEKVDNGPDGQFGRRITYQPGASFDALIRKDATPEAVEAEARTHKERYTVVVKKGVRLDYDEIIVRDADGLTLRLTSSTLDSEAPAVSTIPIAKAEAERWEVPT